MMHFEACKPQKTKCIIIWCKSIKSSSKHRLECLEFILWMIVFISAPTFWNNFQLHVACLQSPSPLLHHTFKYSFRGLPIQIHSNFFKQWMGPWFKNFFLISCLWLSICCLNVVGRFYLTNIIQLYCTGWGGNRVHVTVGIMVWLIIIRLQK